VLKVFLLTTYVVSPRLNSSAPQSFSGILPWTLWTGMRRPCMRRNLLRWQWCAFFVQCILSQMRTIYWESTKKPNIHFNVVIHRSCPNTECRLQRVGCAENCEKHLDKTAQAVTLIMRGQVGLLSQVRVTVLFLDQCKTGGGSFFRAITRKQLSDSRRRSEHEVA